MKINEKGRNLLYTFDGLLWGSLSYPFPRVKLKAACSDLFSVKSWVLVFCLYRSQFLSVVVFCLYWSQFLFVLVFCLYWSQFLSVLVFCLYWLLDIKTGKENHIRVSRRGDPYPPPPPPLTHHIRTHTNREKPLFYCAKGRFPTGLIGRSSFCPVSQFASRC